MSMKKRNISLDDFSLVIIGAGAALIYFYLEKSMTSGNSRGTGARDTTAFPGPDGTPGSDPLKFQLHLSDQYQDSLPNHHRQWPGQNQ